MCTCVCFSSFLGTLTSLDNDITLIDEEYWSKEKCNYTYRWRGQRGRFESKYKNPRQNPYFLEFDEKKSEQDIASNTHPTFLSKLCTAPYCCSGTSHTRTRILSTPNNTREEISFPFSRL